MKKTSCAATGLAAATLLLVASPAVAQMLPRHGDMTASTAQSNLGGGFIEMLMTGRNPSPRPSAQPLPPPPAYTQPPPEPQVQRRSSAGFPVTHRSGFGDELSTEQQPRAVRPQMRQQQAALNPDFRQVEQQMDPKFLPQVVEYSGAHRPGTIVIDTSTRFLYLVEDGGKARRYGVGIGRPGFEWRGTKTITRKAEWPDWRPPAEMLKRRPDLPRFMAGGPENPMGARGLYLGSSLFRIHGTNEPHTIGQAVSSGCFRMRNEDVTDLYERVRVGTRVVVL